MTHYNPTRRNRNIGTAAQGHCKNNRLVIPRARSERFYYESVASFEVEQHTIHGRNFSFVRERLQADWLHACSVPDVVRLLEIVPAVDLASMNCILFRQPTQKQSILNPTWGRLTYWAALGVSGQHDIYTGPLVTLEACRNPSIFKWSKSLSIAAQAELERLREDGHTIKETSRNFVISGDEQTIRNTQLLRTLPHEIGHWVDYLEKVERPCELEPDRWSDLNELYFSRPYSEREEFAHRYARELRSSFERSAAAGRLQDLADVAAVKAAKKANGE